MINLTNYDNHEAVYNFLWTLEKLGVANQYAVVSCFRDGEVISREYEFEDDNER